MKKKVLILLAVLLTIGTSVWAQNLTVKGKIPSTSGRLTITDIPGKYNNMYLIAPAGTGQVILTAAKGYKTNSETVVLGKISGGKVTLNVWEVKKKNANESELLSYSGNHKLTFVFSIYNKAEIDEKSARDFPIGTGMVNVTFRNGTGSGAASILF